MFQSLKANRPTPTDFAQATGDFYTAIPHAFGFAKGPILDSENAIAEKVIAGIV